MIKEFPIIYQSQLRLDDISLSHDRVFSYPIHGHEYYEILIYEPFDGEISVNGLIFRTRTPTAILITPKDFHSTTAYSDVNTLCFKLQISCEIFEKHFGSALSPTVTQNHERVAFLQTLGEQGFKNRDNLEFFLRCIELIVLSLQKSTEKISFNTKSASLVRKAIDIINKRFQEPLTLESVAAELYVSPQYLSSIFSKYAKMGFNEYLINCRLAYAASALKNGATVTEACFQSGYRNLSHFLRTFKKRYNETPAKFSKSTTAYTSQFDKHGEIFIQ